MVQEDEVAPVVEEERDVLAGRKLGRAGVAHLVHPQVLVLSGLVVGWE